MRHRVWSFFLNLTSWLILVKGMPLAPNDNFWEISSLQLFGKSKTRWFGLRKSLNQRDKKKLGLDEGHQLFSTLAILVPPRPALSYSRVIEEETRLLCFISSFFRISRFFNRDEVIIEIEWFFNSPSSKHSLRTLALFELDGVGKSSVALKYAEKKLQNSEFDAMFWMPNEKFVIVQQTVTGIVLRFKLPDAQTADYSENHAFVINWLQHIQCRWLIIYDNVESMDVLLPYWPAAGHGQAILSTRNRRFAFDIAQRGLEIESWDASTDSQFLLYLLATNIGDQLTADDIQSANQLSEKLSGHALAISHMAGLIHGRGWSIAEFIEDYDQQPQIIHGIFDNKSINALWNISFKTLDPWSRAILGVLSYLSPDSVPQAIFESKAVATALPDSLKFCASRIDFWDAIDKLLTWALVKRDRILNLFLCIDWFKSHSDMLWPHQKNKITSIMPPLWFTTHMRGMMTGQPYIRNGTSVHYFCLMYWALPTVSRQRKRYLVNFAPH